ncbi:hypothetical protein [Acinetobacter sp. G11]|uniref:hypothetical protein n=1 Tax=Acinetobacter sp. G11 TaxID=3415989 RepID=UPI003C7BBFBD
MRKPLISEDILDEYFYDDGRDYKMSEVLQDNRQSFASVKKWLYLGADDRDSNFAKVGITEGNLASRSYSSANPRYYLFCAFKFKYNISKEDMEFVENDILLKLDNRWCDRYGRSKRLRHYESNVLSECFEDVDFVDFYKDLHYLIYTYHRDKFEISGYQANEFDESEVEFIYCIFNKKLPKKENVYIEMILQ